MCLLIFRTTSEQSPIGGRSLLIFGSCMSSTPTRPRALQQRLHSHASAILDVFSKLPNNSSESRFKAASFCGTAAATNYGEVESLADFFTSCALRNQMNLRSGCIPFWRTRCCREKHPQCHRKTKNCAESTRQLQKPPEGSGELSL